MFTDNAYKNGLIVVAIIYLTAFLTVGYLYVPESVDGGKFTNLILFQGAWLAMILTAIAVNHLCLARKYGQFVILLSEVMVYLSLRIIIYIHVNYIV